MKFNSPVQNPGWTRAGMARSGITFSVAIIKMNAEPQEGTEVNSRRDESRPGIM